MKQEDFGNIKKVRLPAHRREELKRVLLAKIDERIRVAGLDRRTEQNTIIQKPFYARTAAVLAGIMLLLVGGGTSLAANRALPGDKLYPVKINVNEKIAGLLAVTDKAKLNLETDLAEKRLEEADQLKDENRLNGQAKQELKKEFDDHIEKIDRAVKAIDQKSGARAAEAESSKIEDRFKAKQSIIQELKSEDSDSKDIKDNKDSNRNEDRNDEHGNRGDNENRQIRGKEDGGRREN